MMKEGVKFLHVSTDEVYGSLGETGYFYETHTTDLTAHIHQVSCLNLMVKAYETLIKCQ